MLFRFCVVFALSIFPILAHAQCKPGVVCKRSAAPTGQRAAPAQLAPAPKLKILKPSAPGSVFKQPERSPGDVIALPKINTPQPPASRNQRPGSPLPTSATQARVGSSLILHICQTPETHCRLNLAEVVPSGKVCHCRGQLGKIK